MQLLLKIPSTEPLYGFWFTLKTLSIYLQQNPKNRQRFPKLQFKPLDRLFQTALRSHRIAMREHSPWPAILNEEYSALLYFFKNIYWTKSEYNDEIFEKTLQTIRKQLRLLTYSKKRRPLTEEAEARLCHRITALSNAANSAFLTKLKKLKS